MAEVNLTTEETDALLEVVDKVKVSRPYQNYMAGVRVNVRLRRKAKAMALPESGKCSATIKYRTI